MPARDLLLEDAPSNLLARDLILRSGPNWAAVGFLGVLGLLHLTIWMIALLHGRIEGYMSLIFGTVFVLAACGFYLTRGEIAILASERRVRLRTGYRRIRFERSVIFSDVRGVRVTLGHEPDHVAGLIELVCVDEVIECPPTPVARQEALCLAMTMGVRLIKVSEGVEPRAGRSDHLDLN
jgi:hypothetical protein